MLYLKSVLVGIGGAIVASVLWTVVAFWVPLFVPMLVDRMLNRGGASGARITSDSILLAALFGFITAAGWALHRFRGLNRLPAGDGGRRP
jgi:hypothetical protein